jgi:hypothetical protein
VLEDVLEHDRTLAFVQVRRVRTRQTLIERVLDREFDLRPRLPSVASSARVPF